MTKIARLIPVALAAFKLAHAVPDPTSQAEEGPVRYLAADAGEGCGLVGDKFGICKSGFCCSRVDHTCRRSSQPCDRERCILHLSSAFTCPDEPFGQKPFYNDIDRKQGFVPFPNEVVEEVPRPHIGSVPYGQVINSCTVPGTIALTFDDGPWAYTSELLDLLDDEDVPATFFVNGSNMDWDQITGHGNPDVLRRMRVTGHQIGSHTWGHPDLATMSEDQAQEQIFRNEHALVSVFGVIPTYLRPPYLSTAGDTLGLADKLGYHVIGLDLDTRDWANDYDAAEQNFMSKIKSSDPHSSSHLVLAHDIHEETVRDFAQFMIKEGRAAGYRFVTVGDCLGDPEYNWYRSRVDGSPLAVKKSHSKEESEASTKIEAKAMPGHKRSNYPMRARASDTETEPDLAAYDVRPTITLTKTTDMFDSLFSDGQLPPIAPHLVPKEVIEKQNIARFHRGGPKITKILETSTPFTKLDSRKVQTKKPIPIATITIDIPFPFSGGQLPPPGVHMKPEIIENTESQEEDTDEQQDGLLSPTVTRLVTRRVYPRISTPTTTIDIELPFINGRLPPPGFHMKPEMIQKAKRQVEDDDDEQGDDDVFYLLFDDICEDQDVSCVEDQTTSSSYLDGEATPTTATPTPTKPTPTPVMSYYSGGPISRAPSTMAFIIGVAVMVVYHV